ncbi:MAG TPA: bifunctional phosphopantothenoylcysteine decarboxylase/phosphopantothenate--cysteine ligase CoaBC [Candidatus Omnitrophota bacterium]|nr:bifunctional phosphopantothenoylcysteine decarboxylase/phosphopantothenate--cysteine ligase CoaBC [Candidatus Omnitrophota bacterium]
MAKKKRVILGVTGSIAAYKAAEIIRRLIEHGMRVSVVMTKEAEYFITPLTLASLSGETVFCEMFPPSCVPAGMPHIDLAREADLLLIAPATANTIGKLAHGIADDLLTCVALATEAPKIIVPAMNTQMYRNPIVQENCQKLKKNGARFIEPIEGKLACGTTGQGHIADETTIVKAVLQILK